MTIARLEAIGFCAHYSTPGDWAFDYAFNLARRLELQLNVFHFLDDPFDQNVASRSTTTAHDALLAVELEKELRFYYEPKLADYLQVGFRLCEDREWSELHRCLTRREFQLLVLPYPTENAHFGGKPIELFADSFVCPLVLVGPYHPTQYRLNRPAAMDAGRIGLSCSGNPQWGILPAVPAPELVRPRELQ